MTRNDKKKTNIGPRLIHPRKMESGVGADATQTSAMLKEKKVVVSRNGWKLPAGGLPHDDPKTIESQKAMAGKDV